MKLNNKTILALTALIQLSNHNQPTSLTDLSNEMKISKVYLEQIFRPLKSHQLVSAIKGPQGGYHLSKPAHQITLFEILVIFEPLLFEPTDFENTPSQLAIQSVIQQPIESKLMDTFQKKTLQDLINHQQSPMYYI